MVPVKSDLKIILAILDPEARDKIREMLTQHFVGSVIYTAKEGLEVMNKYTNDPVALMILDRGLPKQSPEQIITNIGKKEAHSETYFIVVGEKPELHEFADLEAKEVVQFLNMEQALSEPLLSSVAKALGRLKSDGKAVHPSRTLKQGQVLLKEGDQGDSVYVLKTGKLRAVVKGSDGKEIELGLVEPGEFVGEIAAITACTRTATVIACVDSELIELNRAAFEQLAYKKPSLTKKVMSVLAKRIQGLSLSKKKAS